MTTAFEQRIKEAVEELTSEAVVSELAFAEIERRIARDRARPPRALVMSAAAAVLVVVMVALVVTRAGQQDEASVASGFERLTFDFEAGPGEAREPAGWETRGLDKGYQVRAVDDRAHRGRWAARVALVGRPAVDGFGAIRRCLPATDAAGQQVRLSGHVAAEGVTGEGAALAVRGFDSAGTSVVYGDSRTTSVAGTHDFTPREVVVDVPDETVELCISGFLSGGGTAWFDDLTVEVVGRASRGAVTDSQGRSFENFGFEDGLTSIGTPLSWTMSGWPAYWLETTSEGPHQGAAAGRLRADQPGYDAAGYAISCSDAPEWLRPGRVQASAWLRPTAITEGRAYLKVLVYRREATPEEARAPADGVDGTGPWRHHQVAIDVPADTTAVCVHVVLTGGAGAIDIDDVEISRDGRRQP